MTLWLCGRRTDHQAKPQGSSLTVSMPLNLKGTKVYFPAQPLLSYGTAELMASVTQGAPVLLQENRKSGALYFIINQGRLGIGCQ